jgi:hypothetical protein
MFVRTWTTVVRVAVVGTAILAGVTAGWSPASAGGPAPAHVSISLTCESFNSWVRCNLYGAETATQPRTITWYVNGLRFTPGDNATYIRHTCVLGQSLQVRAVVVGGNGTGEATSTVGCVTGRP